VAVGANAPLTDETPPWSCRSLDALVALTLLIMIGVVNYAYRGFLRYSRAPKLLGPLYYGG